jgi:hypothetical protein
MTWLTLLSVRYQTVLLTIGEACEHVGRSASLKARRLINQGRSHLRKCAKSLWDVYTGLQVRLTPLSMLDDVPSYAWCDLCNSDHKRALAEVGRAAFARSDTRRGNFPAARSRMLMSVALG